MAGRDDVGLLEQRMSINNVEPGVYFDPGEPGWGFSLHSDGANGLAGYLFCHDPFGNRLWLTMNANGILTKHNGVGFPGRYADGVPANCGIVQLSGNKDGSVSMTLALTADSINASASFLPYPFPHTHTATLAKII
jgi:hypothetical protein